MPKNRLVWRKTSLLLNPCNSTMSLGSRRVSSKIEAMWQPIPPLKSLIDAMSIRGSPPSMGARSHAWGSGNWTSPLSDPRLEAWLVLCCLDGLWASSSLEGRGLWVVNILGEECLVELQTPRRQHWFCGAEDLWPLSRTSELGMRARWDCIWGWGALPLIDRLIRWRTLRLVESYLSSPC